MSVGKKIAISLVGAVALWAGTTAYISSNTKNHLQEYLDKTNKLYQSEGMSFSLLSFEKGFLTSKAKVALDFTDPTIKEEVKELLKLPIEMDYEIENGPLLFKNGFTIGASRINNEMNISELLTHPEELKEVIKEDIIFSSSSLVDFSNHVQYQGQTNPIVALSNQSKFTISPLTIAGEMDAKTFTGDFNFKTEEIDGELQGGGKLHIADLSLNGDITKFFENGFYLGDFTFAIKSLSMQDKTAPIELKNAKVNMAMQMKQNEDETIKMKLSSLLDVGENPLPDELAVIKTFSFDYGIDGTRLEAWMLFQESIKKMQQKQQEIINRLTLAQSEQESQIAINELMLLQEQSQEEILQIFPKFLVKDKTKLELNALITNQSNAKTQAHFDLTYVGDENLPTNPDELKAKFEKELLNWVKLNLNVDIEKSMADKLPQELQQQLAVAMMTGMLKDNNSSYSFNANYVPKKLMVNGEDKSDMLILFEMGFKQGGV